MRLRSVLAMADLGLELLTGEEELDRRVRWVVTTDLLDPGRYLSGDELVITGLHWRRNASDSASFVRVLAGSGVAGIVAGRARYGEIPLDVVEACRDHGVPLFQVSEAVPFATVTEQVNRGLSAGRSAGLSAVLDRHRHVVAGSGLDAVLGLIERDLGIRCSVVSCTGRVVAGLPMPLTEQFGTALGSHRLPLILADTGTPYSVFAVNEQGASRVADWFLICEGDCADWPEERRTVLRELAAVVSLERARANQQTAADRIAQELIDMIVREAEPAEVISRLDFTGLGSSRHFIAVAAAVSAGLRAGELPIVLREILSSRNQFAGGVAAVGVIGGEAIALIPADGDAISEIRRVVDVLAAGLRGGELSLGISGSADREGLGGAVEEARYACRSAVAGPQPVRVVSHDELATHLLLLYSVPDEVRRIFRLRLLTPLHTYDRQHRTDLVSTLEAFLRASGAWTTCADLLHIHVNTLRYRIQRIEELTGRDLSQLADRVDFFLALALGEQSGGNRTELDRQ
ncbi:PucR family transcriptional regulator [Nocardia uniformis]|uniref:PucR family transcriptional regulator n=1 Tax=Nocardia uniformis TaxID=53432 RepID=A0A849C8Z7_9NOCA|nr:PucR family transcriptional regulator [Nocardia uniformis]NNH71329.1 PucR family transcriptional regulator [Nocardia uniformis]